MADLTSSPLMMDLLTTVVRPLTRALFFFLDRSSPLYWPYLLATPMLGWLGWRWFERGTPGSFRSRHFNRAQWWHPSARADYRYYLVNALVFALLVLPLVLSSAWLADHVARALAFGFGTSPGWSAGLGTKLVYTLLFFIAYDLGRWLSHTLLHDVPMLWEFHKIHHSAEVLTPITAFRVHPVDLLLTLTVTAVLTSLVTGLFLHLYADAVTAFTFLGANFVIGLSGLIANLKHWQVWFRYGPLDGWWISPAHHQIHHSANPAHWGKNRGFELGIWDRWYGSLHVPAATNEVTAMGLGDGTDGQWHSVRTLYFAPFVAAWKRLTRRGDAATGTMASTILIAVMLMAAPRVQAAAEASTVQLDELTWPELAERIKAGATTVLIPIGGIEQNGPAMAFAKHNAIARAAADTIARRVGQTLVAPVIPFSPAGGTAPRTAHMQWPGTISLRDTTMTAVLDDVVTSLALAGFTRIVLMGDHGGSQPLQAALAQKLNATLGTRGVTIVHLDRYYEPAPLAERVKAAGADPADAGDHAGLVDTSELLAVAPALVRRDRLAPERWAPYRTPPGPGSSGRPDKASAELGQRLLQQRIDAAVAQLRAASANPTRP